MSKQLVVIGGGAAGFFCAVNAARLNPELRVTILEKSSQLLAKVRISGGGRCNLTHACTAISEMSVQYPRGNHFVKKAFHRFFVSDTIQWFTERGVPLKTEADGRMFPASDQSASVIDCLLKEANRFRVEIRMKAEVIRLSREHDRFTVFCRDGRSVPADFVCVAAGGYPRSDMFDWLRLLGHTIEPPVPSLFTFNLPGHPITQLMGVSVSNARVRIPGTKLDQTGPVLITHWGLSGPAVLRVSAWGARWLAEQHWQFTAVVNWLGEQTEQGFTAELQTCRRELAGLKIRNKNPFGLPARLWEYLLQEAAVGDEQRWADLPGRELNRLVKCCCHYELSVKGKTGFKEEFVTAGGIRLTEVDPQTMQSRRVHGLFFAGELLDVDGVTGGYNFQHAWTSGFIAAEAIAQSS